jgi:asparagine synthase (glutamine-hydrolysing)
MLPIVALSEIHTAVRQVEMQGVPGVLVESGCALGGSSIVICAAKTKERELRVYDVFSQIPPPSEMDGQDVRDRYAVIANGQARGIRGDLYYGYQDNLLMKVRKSFERYGYALQDNNVRLIKGLFQDTLEVAEPVAFAHIDGDWYESVKTCIERIYPRLSKNGIIIVDDYFAWSGCRRAIDDYFAQCAVQPKMIRKKRLHIIRE